MENVWDGLSSKMNAVSCLGFKCPITLRNYTPLTIAKKLLSSRTKADTGTKASCPHGHGNGCIVFVNISLFFSPMNN